MNAVAGRLFPSPGGGGFVGWVRTGPGETPEIVVPGGFGFLRKADPVEVPNTPIFRAAVRRGDLALAAAAEKKKGAK